jgi:hypothetical protein
MAAAFGAVLPRTELRFLEHREMFSAVFDPHGFGFPQTEGVDGAAGPRAAGSAMAITHRFRRSRNFDFNRAAKAFACQTHNISSFAKGATRRRNCNAGLAAFRKTREGSCQRPAVLDCRDQSCAPGDIERAAFAPARHVCVASLDRMTPNGAPIING